MSEVDRKQLLDLIVAWDELRDRGETVGPEELCPNDPLLQAALRQRIAERLRIEQLIATPSTDAPESPGKPSSSHVQILPGQQAGNGSEGPERVGRYRVERLLGSGGFGRVFLAYDDALSRYVAVKIPHRELLLHARYVETYRREARAVAGLDHPHIVPVYDVGSTDTHPCFIVSKYIPGTNLFVRMSQSRLSCYEAVTIVATIAEALHYTHALGVVHRDVKPVNILLSTAGEPFLVDFGLALNECDAIDGRRFAGTPAYMSPEQARGEAHRVDGRSDIFSLGVVFYELLTRNKPLRGESDSDLLAQIASVEPTPPCQIDETIPKELERICLKAISKRAGDRYRTAHDFAEDLRYFLKNSSTLAGFSPSERFPFVPNQSAATTSPGQTDRTQGTSPVIKIVPKGLRSFDAHDADFFLELLPGPRDRDGLPDSIRFWKTRIEDTDQNETFSVGLIYGPSGCGKSSLMKAGLLPHLSNDIIVLYLEATPDEMETRLLHGLRNRCPSLPDNLNLTQTLAELRRGQGVPAGKKVLIVLDQFEQWLHANKEQQHSELIQTLRQCDGGRVQCLVMVRDDFWLAISRFMQELEIRLIEGQNSALVDLFDLDHARKVLAAFGRAYGRLPENSSQTTREQKEFLNRSVKDLAQEGKVISVRLSLFAEMMKGKAWVPVTLKAMGGMEGVGVTFLEETFSASTAPPDHRYHQQAIIKVLKSLLPEFGTEIKGNQRSYDELLAASDYVSRPQDFQQVLRILDREMRLITPTDSDDAEDDAGTSPKSAGLKCYQLTHDYLVPSLRDWLIVKQKETRRGRAELLMSVWSSVWNTKPENRNLPGLFEWSRMLTITQKRDWTEPQRKMMRAASSYYLARGAVAGLILMVATVTGLAIRNQVVEQEQADVARGLVRTVVNAEIVRVPAIIDNMSAYRKWINPLLREAVADTTLNARQKLNASLALLRVDSSLTDDVYHRLLQAVPDEVPVICTELAPHKGQLVHRLWSVVESSTKDQAAKRLCAAAALAQFDPDSVGWTALSPSLTEQIVNENPFFLRIWNESFRPIKSKLHSSLAEVYRDPNRSESQRSVATNFLCDYAADQPEILANLLMDGDAKQFAALFPLFKETSDRGEPILEREIERSVQEANTDEKETLAKRQANAAVALLKIHHSSKIWTLLKHSPDPRARSFLIHRFFALGADPGALIDRLEIESDISICRALILSLGEFDEQTLTVETRLRLIPKLRDIFRADTDSGLHAAAEWLLRQWNDEAWLKETIDEWVGDQEQRELRFENIRRSLTGSEQQKSHDWYINSQGQTLVVVQGPIEFTMGSPDLNDGQVNKERRHTRRIRRSFSIATTSVTVEQYRRIDGDYGNGLPPDWVRAATLPVIGINWFMGAKYCNWLSEREGLPADQWCFSIKGQTFKLKKDYLTLNGYRFPTEAEMEYATRSGALTARYFGETEELLTHYAWYQKNSQEKFWPVGTRKPNDLGLFDTHGNVFIWCLESFQLYPEGEIVDDNHSELTIPGSTPRALRGGSFIDRPPLVRSAYRNADLPTTRSHNFGLRIARTIGPVPVADPPAVPSAND